MTLHITKKLKSKYLRYPFFIVVDERIPMLDKAPDDIVKYNEDVGAYELNNTESWRLIKAFGHLEWTFDRLKKGKVVTELRPLYNKYISFKGFITEWKQGNIQFNPDLFKIQPRPHQLSAVNTLYKTQSYLLADEMGSGKTMTSVYSGSLFYGHIKHVLIICGIASTQLQWEAEIKKFSDIPVRVIGKRINRNNRVVIDGIEIYKTKTVKGKTVKTDELHPNCKVSQLRDGVDEFFLIANIESFRNKMFVNEIQDMVERGEIAMVIIDEAHVISNTGSSQGQQIVSKINPMFRLPVTGTPVFSRPLALHGIMKWMWLYKGTKKDFEDSFAVKDIYGRVVSYHNLDILEEILHKNMLRRKAPHTVDLIVEDKIIYDPTYVDMGDNYKNLVQTSLSKEKIKAIYSDVEAIVGQGDKVLILTMWKKEVIDTYVNELKSFNPIVITGDTSTADRDEDLNKFKTSNKYNVLIGTIGAIGTGVSLKEAKYVLFINRPYNYSEYKQALARIHRLDSEEDVYAYIYKVANSIDTERLEEILEEKKGYLDELGLNDAVDIKSEED